MDVAFSPLDRRYKSLIPVILSEEASFDFQIKIEGEWLKTLRDEKICPAFTDEALDRVLKKVTYARVEAIEERTQHATRALVEAVSEVLADSELAPIAHWVHVGLTSFDVVDTAARLRLKAYLTNEWFPLIEQTQGILKKIGQAHAQTLQAGRTHGQWAVPTYFGVSMAEAYSRIEQINTQVKLDAIHLRGQASGAIGGYHASALLAANPLELEKKFLVRLGLAPHYGSTQILPPEDIVQAAQSIFLECSVVAKLATDWRHLARSEIGEIYESMGEGQVGSSTMPQKRNPWNLEHVCSLFKVLKSKLTLLQDDLITEHQRDLTNSASGRFYFEFFAVAHLLVSRFIRVAKTIQVDDKKMKANFDSAGSTIFAEALYVTLTQQGVEHAHDRVREAARHGEKTGKDLLQTLQESKLIDPALTHAKLMEKTLEGSKLKLAAIFK